MTTIRPPSPDDMPHVLALLAAADLPTEDITDPAIALACSFDGPLLVGVIGVQTCGDTGLLRSLAVAPSRQLSAVSEG